MEAAAIGNLIAAQRPGFCLEQVFYRDPDIYARDLERIFLNAWLYAGHASQVPEPGDYFLFEFATESIIVTRDREGALHALVNVCRHRGSRVCLTGKGRARRFTCPYHGWTYGADGTLLAATQMPEDFDKGSYGLKRVSLRLFHGLIFVNLAPDPVPFDTIEAEMSAGLSPYRLDRAKVAHAADYPIAANWKLAVENYCECYHCRPAHPEYSRAHALAAPPAQWQKDLERVKARAAEVGLSTDFVDHAWLDADAFGTERQFWRYPLLHGHQTGSRDGEPVAPLLGELTGYDGGATDIQIGPVLFGLAYCDHVVLYRFTPVAIDRSVCQVSWLVNEDAVEGRDYSVEELTWLWDVTTQADKTIIENNQKGVNSRFFEPGPLSNMERFENRFVRWYLAAVT